MSAFQNPLVRYGIAIPSAVVVAAVGFFVFDGIAQLFAFALAAMELLVLPQILKRVE